MKSSRLSGLTPTPSLARALAFAFALAILAGSATRSHAGNSIQYFFPIPNAAFNTEDDEIVVKSIFRSEASQPVQWVLFNPGGQALTQTNPSIEDAAIIDALKRALREWNSVAMSSFDFSESVFTTISGLVDPPVPVEARFDGHNLVTFRSSMLNDANGPIVGVSLFFMERDVNKDELTGLLPDAIESSSSVSVDLNGDHIVDITLPLRDYAQAEIIETDIVFNTNTAFKYQLWPANRANVPDNQQALVYGSLDIQALLTQALGLAQGIGPSLLYDATMHTQGYGQGSAFPTDPYNVRELAFDDELAAGLLYPKSVSGMGEIQGQTLDGQYVSSLPPGSVPDTANPNIQDSVFVVQAPVFLGRPASQFPAGVHPDNVVSSTGMVRLIAQVLSGQSLRYPARTGGVSLLEPAAEADPNIDFNDVGEDLNGNGLLDPGEDINNDNILQLSTRDIDGNFRFRGLPAQSDYVLYMDKNYGDGLSPGYVYDFLSQLESFPKEFYGGGNCDATRTDDAENDYDLAYSTIPVAAGQVVTGIDLVTNVSNATPCPTPIPSPTPSQSGNNALITGFEIPIMVTAGETIPIKVFAKNTGSVAWTETGGYKIATIRDICSMFPTRLGLAAGAIVAPGETGEFTGSVATPSNIVGGSCSPTFQMIQEFVEFFGEQKSTTMSLEATVTSQFSGSTPSSGGWLGGVVQGGSATSLESAGLCMEVPEAGNNILGWVSPERYIELVDYALYRFRVSATTNQTTANKIPLWDVVYDNFNSEGYGNVYGGESWFLDVAGGANGIGRSNGRTTFDVYAMPTAAYTPQWRGLLGDGTLGAFDPSVDATNDMRLVIRTLDIESAGINAAIDYGKICVGSIQARRFPKSSVFVGSTALYDTPISTATHIAGLNGQQYVSANINDETHVATFALATNTGSRATLIPGVDPSIAIPTVAKLYPVEWIDDALYVVFGMIQTADSQDGLDPVDALMLSMDSTTSEVGQTHGATSGSPGNFFRTAAPRRGIDAGGPQTYVAFFHAGNATDYVDPTQIDFRRLRPLVDFFNTPELYGTGTGANAVEVHALQVWRATVLE